jgi:hypothetical protein
MSSRPRFGGTAGTSLCRISGGGDQAILQGCVSGLGQTVDEASSRTPSGNDIGLLFALTRLPDRKLGFALHYEALRKVVGRISIVNPVHAGRRSVGRGDGMRPRVVQAIATGRPFPLTLTDYSG